MFLVSINSDRYKKHDAMSFLQ